MSMKRPTESTWDSDEELLNDTSGSAVTAFPKTSELDLLGDDGELDEDALLGVDETGAKNTSISFTNDSVWPLATRQRSKNTIGHQQHASLDEHVEHGNEQAFVFEESDTADLEDELNVGVQEEDGSGYHGGRDYSTRLYHQGGNGSTSDMTAIDDHHVDYTAHGMTTTDYLCTQTEQTSYGDDSGAEFGDAGADGGYIGEAVHDAQEDVSGVELEYEQPVEQEGQVHLEYEDSHTVDQEHNLDSQEPKNPNYESESDSDDENSRHSRGKFTSERTGVISLAAANTREAIPDTLEINEEQAAQIEQFMSDKSQKGKGKGRGQSRPSAHSRLGSRSGTRHQQNSKMSPGSRNAHFPRGMLGQNFPLGFPFGGGPPSRSHFLSLLNRGPFPLRLLNQQGPFSGPQNQRQAFPLGPGTLRGSFSVGSMNMLLGGPQRGLLSYASQERFPRAQNQRGAFAGGPRSLGSQRSQQQNLRNPSQGPQQIRGPQPNQLRLQGSFNQRMVNPTQFGQRPPIMGHLGARQQGPRNMGPRPLMGQEPGMRFVRPNRPQTVNQGQPIPSLVKPVTGPGKPLLGNQQLRPGQINPLLPSDPRRTSPHQRLGPMQGPNRFQNPTGLPQGPRFMSRPPQSGGPFMNPPVFQGNQPQMGGQGDVQNIRKHKIYINPRFQNQQAAIGAPGLGRTVKMGVPVQQKKAKVLLERAIQTQNKQASTAPVAPLTAVKRKSTGGESVPSKIIKSDVNKPEMSETSSTRVVQATSDSTDEAQKMKALLEEQRRQREMIQRKKELARQKQAAIKRRELEARLKEEGKTINDILGTAKAEKTVEQKQVAPPIKQISGSVAARLGPPPTQQQVTGPLQPAQLTGPAPVRMRQPFTQGSSAPPKPQQFSVAPQQSQNFQARTPAPASAYQPKLTAPLESRMRGPPPSNDPRFRGPPPNTIRLRGQSSSNDPRFQAPTVNQFRAPVSSFDTRYSAPRPSQDRTFRGPPPNADPRLRGPPPSADPRLRGPPPMTDPRLRGPTYQSTTQSSATLSQSVRYTVPPPSSSQTTRFQTPQSAPPQVSVQAPTTQQFQSQYTPASAQPSHPPSHYAQPRQSDSAVYAPSVPQYAPQIASYQPSVYPPQGEHQYQPQSQHPQPSESFNQPATSQYHLTSQQQYQTPLASQYQTPPPAAQYQMPLTQQYQNPPTQTQYQTPSVQTHYQASPSQPQYQALTAQPTYQAAPPSQTQYQALTAQPTYQAPPAQTQYQTPQVQLQYQTSTIQHYQNSTQSYSAPPESHYQQVAVGYCSEPQPIQTVTSQTATAAATAASSPVGDQRTVQHHTPVGQRIQTIGQRVQPISDTHMRSIIQNVASEPNNPAKVPQTRLVQSQTTVSRVVTGGQVQVLDGPQKILIQNVPQMATKETLIKICRHFGQVLGVNLMAEQNKAVVQFQKGEQAAKCVAKCDQEMQLKMHSRMKKEIMESSNMTNDNKQMMFQPQGHPQDKDYDKNMHKKYYGNVCTKHDLQ